MRATWDWPGLRLAMPRMPSASLRPQWLAIASGSSASSNPKPNSGGGLRKAIGTPGVGCSGAWPGMVNRGKPSCEPAISVMRAAWAMSPCPPEVGMPWQLPHEVALKCGPSPSATV